VDGEWKIADITCSVSKSSPGWVTYTSPTFGVILQYPADWQPVRGYEERYRRPDGFFQVGAIGGREQTSDQVCDSEAHHKVQTYGTQPEVEITQIQGQNACWILSS
jgi:hypothetical protein